MSAKHTPGPLHVEAGGGRYDDDGEWDSVIIVPDADNETMLAELLWRKGDAEAEAQTRADAVLFAAAPDHALLLAAFARDGVRWEPFNLNARYPETNIGRGEVCIGGKHGVRYATELDDFGCPIVNDAIRAALARLM